MKIKGRELYQLPEETIVIPRGGEEPIVFKARAVTDWAEFNKLVQEPVPPQRMVKGKKESDFKNPSYLQRVAKYNELTNAWLILESLKATPDLEWDLVKADQPDSWLKLEEELRQFLLPVEIRRIIQGVFQANALDEKHVEAARKAFLERQEAESHEKSSGEAPDPTSTSSTDTASE